MQDDVGEHLFSKHTEKTVLEQMKKAEWVVDTLKRSDLYMEVLPNVRSQNQLKCFVGARGTESKLEKGHHAIAHFANGGMRHTLADFLGMAGIAMYNLRIRYRLRLDKLTSVERAKIPAGFQQSPDFTNHFWLAHLNKLAAEAGSDSVHKNVEVLQPDNGEHSFFEYWLQEQERQKAAEHHDVKSNRCLCRDCGKVNNPYRKRKDQIEVQEDVAPTTAVLPPVPTAALPPLLMPLVPLPEIQFVGAYSAILAAGNNKTKRQNKKKSADN